MKVKEVVCAAGRSGYMHRDLAAIKSGNAIADVDLCKDMLSRPGFVTTEALRKQTNEMAHTLAVLQARR